MPLKLDAKRVFSARSDRVKALDLHPTEPWALVALYCGQVHIWDFQKSSLVKSQEICALPVRAAKFVPRKSWFVAASDDNHVRVYNYNTLEKIAGFEAHSDYIRCVAIHPTQPYILTGSDDTLIKLWDWDKEWQCIQVFEGHGHFVFRISFNPRDNNIFSSASLDRTIKVWQIGQTAPNFTLVGHASSVNCVEYFQGGDKPYMISGGDDRCVKIWDYQNKSCVQTLEGHAHNVTCAAFHPELPLIITGSEDGTVRIWNSNTYRLETALNYGLERVWCLGFTQSSNCVAIGYDEGTIIVQLGREDPAVSMDSGGKLIFARHSEIYQANVRNHNDGEVKDGERLTLSTKVLGNCDIYPQDIKHNPNGRFVVMCGDGEYIIYTAMALRNKAFGSGIQEFVWSADSSEYAIRESSLSKIKVFKNFKETRSLTSQFGAEGLFGGQLLGVRSATCLSFYTWDTLVLVRRIMIVPTKVWWSESGELVAICTNDSFFILRFDRTTMESAFEDCAEMGEDGIEEAFEVVSEVDEVVRTGVWAGDCFLYTNSVNRLNYFVGGEIVTICHLDRTMYVVGYLAKENRVYLCDRDINVVSYLLSVVVLEYQTAIMRQDFDTADRLVPQIPDDQRSRVARFLEKQGFKKQALRMATDPDHRFDIALALQDVEVCMEIATHSDDEPKWKQIGDMALKRGKIGLAEQCLKAAKDYNGQLLIAVSVSDQASIDRLGNEAKKAGKYNVAFLSKFVLNDLDGCIDLLVETERVAEAALFARTHRPSRMSELVQVWKDDLAKTNPRAAESLADPGTYPNLFPELDEALELEKQRAVYSPEQRGDSAIQLADANGDSDSLDLDDDDVGDVNLDDFDDEDLDLDD